MSRTTPSLDPNDPENKLVNDRRFYAALVESIITENFQQVWRMEGWKLEARNAYLRQKHEDIYPNSSLLPPVFASPSLEESKKTETVIKDLKEAIQAIIAATQTTAIANIKIFVANNPSYAAVSTTAQVIAEKVYSETLPQEIAVLSKTVNMAIESEMTEFTQTEMVKDVIAEMQAQITTLLAKAFQEPDPHKRLMKITEASTALAYAREVKEAAKNLPPNASQAQTRQLVEIYDRVISPLTQTMSAEIAETVRGAQQSIQRIIVDAAGLGSAISPKPTPGSSSRVAPDKEEEAAKRLIESDHNNEPDDTSSFQR